MMTRKEKMLWILYGIVLLLLFLLSFVSKGGIGSGDGLLFVVIGIFLGGACVLTILLYAVILSGGYALYLFVFRKK